MNNSANSQEIQGIIQIRTKQKLRKLIESYYVITYVLPEYSKFRNRDY